MFFKHKLIDPSTGQVSLRCIMLNEEGQFVAMCLDLCLAAQADTPEEARQKLHDQVIDYVIDALHDGALEQRPAPLEYWLQYYSLKIKRELGKAANKANGKVEVLFKDKLPLTPDLHRAA